MGGLSPVFKGLMYDIMVIEEPRPLFCEIGGLELPMSFLADAGRGTLSRLVACVIEGNDAMDFRVLSGVSRFPSVGLKGVGTGDVGIGESEESTVRDFLSGTGLGAIIGAEELVLLNCHLSKTDPLRRESLSFSGVAYVEDELLACVDASSWVLALTMFCTKPRPCNLLILGVGSFAAGLRRKVGDAVCPKAI